MGRGMSFEEAVNLVKQAALGDIPAAINKKIVGAGKAMGKAIAPGIKEGRKGGVGIQARKDVANLVKKNPRAAVGAVAGAGTLAVGAGVHKAMKKKAEYTDMDKAAAVGYLMDNGIDFDTAIAAVSEAAAQ